MEFMARWQQEILGATRIITALLYTQHGLNKMMGFPRREGQDWEFPEVMSLRIVSGTLELICGPLMALGLWTRPQAFVNSGHMAAAYFIGHWYGDSFFPYVNGGDASILFCFVFLLVSTFGPGAWALDNQKAGVKAAAE